MKVELRRQAIKALDKIPHQLARNIVRQIDKLSQNPFPPNSLKLAGRDNYRLRIGVYRVIYYLNLKQKTLTILRVAHRREVYRP